MSLFQPTNVTPSVFGPTGSGVVDASGDLTITWQVNGNSAMTAYMVQIYTNDTTNTLLYDSGRLTTNCPFYGTKANGEVEFFSHTIPAGTMTPPTNAVSSTGSVTGVACNYEQFAAKTGSQTGTLTFYAKRFYNSLVLWGVGQAPLTIWDAIRLDEYGISYDGAVTIDGFFMVNGTAEDGDTITVSMTAGYGNGASYKSIITMWWSDTESVTQTNGNVFITRETPTLTMGDIPSPVASRSNTFTAVYSQPQGDALSFVRWQIAVAGQTENPVFDTGKVFGTAQLSITYDGLFPDTIYAVRCSGETSSGTLVDTGWTVFSVDYPTSDMTGYVTAACSGGDGVAVGWSRISYIMGTGSGTFSVTSQHISLDSGASVTWNEVSGNAMQFPAPWSVFYQGTLCGESVTLFSADTSGGALALEYNNTTQTLRLAVGGFALAVQENIPNTAEITAVVTPDTFYLRTKRLTGGLYPSNTLYPSGTLYPRDDDIVAINTYTFPISYTQGSISELRLSGRQVADWLYVCMSGQESSYIAAAMDGTFSPAFDEIAYFCADFSNGLNAGNLQSEDPLTGVSVYRRTNTESGLTRLAALPLNQVILLDRAVTNGNAYTYYVFPESENAFSFAPLVSNSAGPCYWDWVLLECSQQEDGTYSVVSEYHFGKNLSTGSMGNNNEPNVLKNFTRWPLVQKDTANYKSGQLTSLIGVIDGTTGEYTDTAALRDMIYALSLTENTLFLKNRKGDLWKIALTGEVSMETEDNSRQQAQTVTLSWAEIGSADGVVILGNATMPELNITGQTKTVSPTFAKQVIKPDAGFTSLTSVVVEPISVTKEQNAAGGYTVTIGQ